MYTTGASLEIAATVMFAHPTSILEKFGLEPGDQVADLGAGSGFYTLAAARAVGDRGRVFAVEVQKDLLDLVKNAATREGLHNVEVIWGDIEHGGGTRLRDTSIDRAIVSNVLFQVENRAQFVLEIQRILKPKGRVLVIEWSDSANIGGPGIRHLLKQKDVRDMFEKESFTFEKELPAGAHHYGLVFSKV